MQLIVDGTIQLYDPMKNRILGLDAVMEKFGVGPDKVIDAQALIGDSTDNVPGAPGIGPRPPPNSSPPSVCSTRSSNAPTKSNNKSAARL